MGLSATWDAAAATVRLVATTWGATVASVTVDRYDGDATVPVPVRGGTALPMVAGQTMRLDDREFPAGLALRYRVRAYNASGVEVPTYSYTATLAAPALSQAWLRAPLAPFLDRPVTITDFSAVTRPARGGVLEVIGRRLPVAVTEVRGSRAWTLTLRAADADERTALEDFLAYGSVIYLLVPAGCAVPPGGYFHVGDVEVTRPRRAPDGRTWYVELPLVEVAAPDPSVTGSTITWLGVKNKWATWGALKADPAAATWGALLQYVSAPTDEVVG